jgi:hypothetical protein
MVFLIIEISIRGRSIQLELCASRSTVKIEISTDALVRLLHITYCHHHLESFIRYENRVGIDVDRKICTICQDYVNNLLEEHQM